MYTRRLLIRNFTDDDLDTLLAYRNDLEVAKYQGWSVPYSREKGEALIAEMKDVQILQQGQWQQLALEIIETGEMIGDIGIRIYNNDARQALIGFTIASNHWRKGYATESITAVLNHLFNEIDLHRVVAECDTRNVASWKTLEKLGFRREAHFVENYLEKGAYVDEYSYAILQREWQKKAGVT